MARKAYFVKHGSLNERCLPIIGHAGSILDKSSKYIFAEYKDIPDKDIDPIDEMGYEDSGS